MPRIQNAKNKNGTNSFLCWKYHQYTHPEKHQIIRNEKHRLHTFGLHCCERCSELIVSLLGLRFYLPEQDSLECRCPSKPRYLLPHAYVVSASIEQFPDLIRKTYGLFQPRHTALDLAPHMESGSMIIFLQTGLNLQTSHMSLGLAPNWTFLLNLPLCFLYGP